MSESMLGVRDASLEGSPSRDSRPDKFVSAICRVDCTNVDGQIPAFKVCTENLHGSGKD